MKKVILFGIGSSSQVAHYHLSQAGYEIAAFTVDQAFITHSNLLDCPVIPFETIEKTCDPAQHQILIAIGYVKVNQLRAERLIQAKAKGFQIMSFVHPKASLWQGCEPGEHCQIGEQSLIQPYSQIGANVYIGSQCLIGHHSILGDHCFLGARVTLAGGVIVEPYAFLGTGAIVRNKARIATASVVGAGAVILEDTKPYGVYMAPGAIELDYNSQQLAPA